MTQLSRVPLGEVASIDRRVVSPSEIEPGTMYVGLDNIQRGGGLIRVAPTRSGQLQSSKFAFDASHVLFGKLRPNLAKIARPSFDGVCSTDILPIRPGERLDRSYLAHFLARPETVDLAASRATGVNLPRLSTSELAKFEILLPPLDVQRGIAATLDRAAAIVAACRTAGGLIDRLRRSIFLEMFEHAPSAWRQTTVDKIVDYSHGGIRTGPFGSQLLHSEFVSSGVRVLGIDNAVSNKFRWSGPRYIPASKYVHLRRYTVHPGDVLITIMGTCGRAAIVPDDVPLAISTKHLCCITLDRDQCLPEYLHAFFLQHPVARGYLVREAKGAIMSGLNMRIIKSMPLVLPPLATQRSFVDRLASVDALSRRFDTSTELAGELFSRLEHDAFADAL